MVLFYSRNKHASVTDREDGSLLVKAQVEETCFAAQVEMIVSLPDLEITSVKAKVSRMMCEQCAEALPLVNKVAGLKVGPGIIKIINGLVGGSKGCPRLAELLLECCDQPILRFTVGPIAEVLAMPTEEEQMEGHREFLRRNPRLADNCVAFAEGSLIREGVEL